MPSKKKNLRQSYFPRIQYKLVVRMATFVVGLLSNFNLHILKIPYL